MPVTTPRQIAYQALLTAYRQEGFITDVLSHWQKQESPDSRDVGLAREIATGTMQMTLALDHLAKQLTTKGKLDLKLKEKIILRSAIYQHVFMDRIPLYAITNEALKLADTHCHSRFKSFLNAALRKVEKASLEIPQDNSPLSLSIRYSHPLWFVDALIKDYDEATAISILECGNLAAPAMARVRPSGDPQHLPEGMTLITEEPFPVARIDNSSMIEAIAGNPNYYIQNITPATLVGQVAKAIPEPKRILDLCAAPGGKTLALFDSFSDADYHVNDVSDTKLDKLRENFARHGVKAELHLGPGELFSSELTFDLIVLDVPCSNTGVLNKRPEARWRLDQEHLQQLESLQEKLITNAAKLLSPTGVICYMTCSILKEENENQVNRICSQLGLHVTSPTTILPNKEGQDGGFSCLLSMHTNPSS